MEFHMIFPITFCVCIDGLKSCGFQKHSLIENAVKKASKSCDEASEKTVSSDQSSDVIEKVQTGRSKSKAGKTDSMVKNAGEGEISEEAKTIVADSQEEDLTLAPTPTKSGRVIKKTLPAHH